jgi:tRNA nucleotidyltransferase/poly(A) polymerase
LHIRLAAVFHDCGKPATKELVEDGATFYGHDRVSQQLAERALKRLRYSNDIIEQVKMLVGKHMFSEEAGEKGIRRLINKVGLDLIFDLIALRRADTLAQGMGQQTASIEEFARRVEDEINKKPAFGIKDLAIDGNDIMTEFSLEPGPIVGELLNYLLDMVLDEPNENNKERLIEIAREYFRKRQLDF